MTERAARNDGPYDFEYPMSPPASCNRCGALVQNCDVHDEWHRSVLTREDMVEAIAVVSDRGVR